jgi:hypothetical protein
MEKKDTFPHKKTDFCTVPAIEFAAYWDVRNYFNEIKHLAQYLHTVLARKTPSK